MLVLSRKRDESIFIGDDIRLVVVDIRGDKVRLGIEAPQTIPVHRQEVYDALKREIQKQAEQGGKPVPCQCSALDESKRPADERACE